MEPSALFDPKALAADIHAALRAWHSYGGTPQNLLGRLLLVEEYRQATGDPQNPAAWRVASNQLLLEALEELASQNATGAQLLRSRFIQDNTLLFVAQELGVSEYAVSRLQKAAIHELADLLYQRERAVREKRSQSWEAFLPPASYSRLFGLDASCTRLVRQLLAVDSPGVTAIVGIGGLGKTALADAVVRELIRHFYFERIIWLRLEPLTLSGHAPSSEWVYETFLADLARQLRPGGQEVPPNQRRAEVRQALKGRPHLVIVDNLESEADTNVLFPYLHDLANPSRFLLTTRTRPGEPGLVFTFSMEELPLADAVALLQHHAQEIGMPDLATTTTTELASIYTVTGGNPLALKLVISLLDVLPLPQILVALRRSQPGPIEKLYRHIYWQSWRALSPGARTLLQAMTLVADSGGSLEYLEALSGLSQEQLSSALQELRNRSLLEIRGTLQEKQYGIHRLTETFLRTEIIHWPDDDSNSETTT